MTNKIYDIKEKGFTPIYKGIPPFMKYVGGYGYYGVLLEDENTGKLQCHLCGHLVLNISQHLRHKHSEMSPRQYRIETGLNLTTPLMSEKTRKLVRNNFLNLTDEKKKKIVDRLVKFNKELHSKKHNVRQAKASIQMNNKYGTCPEQVRSKFWSIYNKLGRVPNLNELGGSLRYIIDDRFGGYETAFIAWGGSSKEFKEHLTQAKVNSYEARREKNFFPKYTDKQVRKQYKEISNKLGRFPTWGEVKQFGLPSRDVFERVFGTTKSDLEKTLKSIK